LVAAVNILRDNHHVPVSKSYHHRDLRAALLRASLDLMRQQESHQFTLREVARRVGVSHAAPFRHFRDKSQLLAAIAEEGFIRLASCLEAAARKDSEPFRRLRNAVVAYVEFSLDAPEQFRVMFSVNSDGALDAAVEAAAQTCFATIVKLVAACDTNFQPGTDQLNAPRIVWAHMHGIASVQHRLGFQSREQILGFATAAIVTLQQGMNGASVTRRPRINWAI